MSRDLLDYMHILKFVALFLLLSTSYFANALADGSPVYDPKARFHPVHAKNGMVASESSYATRAGIEVLREGGNAVDAAVTVGFVLAVTFPRAGNLGGGGFMVAYLGDKTGVIALDYRETAPKAAKRDMFLDTRGNVDKTKSRHSILSVGVPGTVAGLTYALENYGTISLERALTPAIKLAKEGFVVDQQLRNSLIGAKKGIKGTPQSLDTYFKADSSPYEVGELLVQPELAKTLEEIAKHGSKAFYHGSIAEKMDGFMKANGGLITKQDMRDYKPILREPVHGNYKGYEIYSMPPPSSGGVHLIQMVNVLAGFSLGDFGQNSAASIHLMAEAMRFAYADRSLHLGDPDFSTIPVQWLISDKYAKSIRERIDKAHAIPSKELNPGTVPGSGGSDTTHFSVVDKDGNAVSNTYTLNFGYGSKITLPGTGILLNNEMDDFSSKPGEPNAYGLLGAEKNAIEPHKRMLSSMTPTIVMRDGKPFLITGSPGGSLIITTVLQVILNVIEYGLNVAEATNAPRVHHQWFPDVLRVEEGISSDTINILRSMGHNVVIKSTMGSADTIMCLDGYLYGASDPRRPGGLAAGY